MPKAASYLKYRLTFNLIAVGYVTASIVAIRVAPADRALAQLHRAGLKFLRGAAADTREALENGGADLTVVGPLRADWERLDHWTLFTERFVRRAAQVAAWSQ